MHPEKVRFQEAVMCRPGKILDQTLNTVQTITIGLSEDAITLSFHAVVTAPWATEHDGPCDT